MQIIFNNDSVISQCNIVSVGISRYIRYSCRQILVTAGESPLSKQTLVITDGKISALKSGFVAASNFAKDAKLIDLSSSFVMAGLMDMHVHLQGELGPNNDSEMVNLSDADTLMKSAYFAKKTLMAGFTTVRDLGSSAEQMFALA